MASLSIPIVRLRKNLSLRKNLRELKNNLKIRIKRRINHLLIKPYKDCNTLLAWKFFKALDTGDYRYILKSKVLPEYSIDKLSPIWDNIITEYDKITGKYNFGWQLMDLNYNVSQISRLDGIKACYELLLLGQDSAIEKLKGWGYVIPKNTHKEREKLKSFYLGEQTKYKIRSERKKATKSDKKGQTFIQAMINLNYIGYTANKDTITLIEFIEAVKQAQEFTKSYRWEK